MKFQSDNPICKIEDDQFNRKEFIAAIVEMIQHNFERTDNKINSENLVIGLYGSWGYGKSSILNILQSELNKSKGLKTIYFNPWMYGSEDQLIASLFSVISKEVDLEAQFETKLRSAFKRYFELVSIISEPISKIGGAILEATKDEDPVTAEEFKNEIETILSNSGVKLVIFIDDVDRLSKNEIHVLFKTLRLIAGFQNIVYVIAMDVDMTAKSIKENYADGTEEDGRSFIEKIIQVPIRLPEITNQDLILFTKNLIESKIGINIELNNELGNVIVDYFNTPRDVIRFINSFRFSYYFFKERVNIEDLFLIEIIRVKDQRLFQLMTQYYFALKSNDPERIMQRELPTHLKNCFPEFYKQDGVLITGRLGFERKSWIFKRLFNLQLQNMLYYGNSYNNETLNFKQYEERISEQNADSISFDNPKILMLYFQLLPEKQIL